MSAPVAARAVTSLRSLEPPDLPAVLGIERASFSTPWSERTFRSLLHRGDADLLVAADAGGVTGYAAAWWAADQAELGNLAVRPESRGRGVGRALLEAMLDRLRLRGVRECFLEVRVSNRAGLALYRAAGFTQAGLRKGYYTRPREDAVVMRKELETPAR
ncbi:MAG: ribosomal protein S18-alanine N-acetyltransferase [Longimicrobiaceae bacterium]